MPKADKIKFYAVRSGREGPKIYHTWDQVSSHHILHGARRVSPDRMKCNKNVHLYTCFYINGLFYAVSNRCHVILGPNIEASSQDKKQKNGSDSQQLVCASIIVAVRYLHSKAWNSLSSIPRYLKCTWNRSKSIEQSHEYPCMLPAPSKDATSKEPIARQQLQLPGGAV